MDIVELIAKVVALLGAVIALPTAILRSSKRSRLQVELEFVEKYISVIEENPHALVVESGYRVLSGDSVLSAPEVLYLLSLDEPSRSLERYRRGRKFLQFTKGVSNELPAINFAHSYLSERKRHWLKRVYLTSCVSTATIALLPILFAMELFGNDWRTAVVVCLITFISFGILALVAVSAYGDVLRAEELVLSQK